LRLTTLVRGQIGKSKIGKTGGCHLFRHTVATLMPGNEADIRVIQEMPGHAKLSTTELYTRVSINLLRQAYLATHPGGGAGAGGTDGDAGGGGGGRRRMIESMEHEAVHVSSAEAIRDIAAILERVEGGAEIVVEKDLRPVALIQPAPRPGRLLSECIALAEAHQAKSGSSVTLDDQFGTDLEEIIASHREPLESRWD
jgi:antitoxin (DNA-binding transcriptional repressor) of toxin-antitoxin stability system